MNTSFDTSIVIRGLLLLLGLVVALIFGIIIGEANWSVLAIIGAIVAVGSLAQFTVRNLAAVCLALATLDFWMAPTGFKLSPIEQIAGVAGFAWLLVCWRKNFNPSAPSAFLKLKSWRFFQNIVFVAAAYASMHFVYNMFAPYDELAFGWKGASKSYLQTFGVFLIIVFLVRAHLLFPLNTSRSSALLVVFLLFLIISVTIGIVRAVVIGPEMESGLSMQEKSELGRLFLIPGLNAHENIYTLRQLGPLAVLIGTTFFFARPRGMGAFLPLSITALGFLGSLVSAGRASVLFAIIFMIAAMVRSRNGPLAFAMGGLFAVAVAAMLILPTSFLKEAPYTIQRSVGLVRPDLKTQATEGIEGSSDWRLNYFQFAWDHYTSGDARMYLFGRSVGQMDSIDFLSFLIANEIAQMEFAVRRLSTHNALTDFLLGWGLIGYFLIITASVACIIMLFSYLKLFDIKSHGGNWIFCSAVFLAFWLVYSHIGGGFLWPQALAMILVALSQTDGLRKLEPKTADAQTWNSQRIERPQERIPAPI
jgi:hypothetical protein